MGFNDLELSEQLIRSTVQLRADNGTGTGFFMNFSREPGMHCDFVVTNKHVIEGANSVEMTLTLLDENELPCTQTVEVTISNIQSICIPHPKDEVDLCIFPTGKAIKQLKTSTGRDACTPCVPLDFIPSSDQIREIDCIEDVVIIGYPIGMREVSNNLPIARKGITATPFKFGLDGQSKFIVDFACFNGSSGSPVYLYDKGIRQMGNSIQIGQNRIHLLGIVSKMYETDRGGVIKLGENEGTIVKKDAIDLGLIESSTNLLDFEPIVKEMIEQRR